MTLGGASARSAMNKPTIGDERKASMKRMMFPEAIAVLSAAGFALRRACVVRRMHGIRQRAEGGDAEARYKLGACHADGEGVEQNFTEAVRWYRKAAEQGFAPAKVGLGMFYRYGLGVEKDERQAAHWLREAAAQGDGAARYALKKQDGA